jgi:hypothetical protein
MRKYVGLVTVVLAGLVLGGCERAVTHEPGILAPDPPLQEKVTKAEPVVIDDYTITPLASFSMTARVLTKKRYRLDRESDLVPWDLAMGWGAMSDQAVVDEIKFSQSGRWYRWRTAHFPIPRREIENSSANMHLIPAYDEVRDEIADTRVGNLIALEGFLVKVQADDGWHWNSSMSRTDRGGGACELILVEKFEILR